MLTTDQMDEILTSLYVKQNERFFKSNESAEVFLARPEEKCVSFQIRLYMLMLDSVDLANS